MCPQDRDLERESAEKREKEWFIISHSLHALTDDERCDGTVYWLITATVAPGLFPRSMLDKESE